MTPTHDVDDRSQDPQATDLLSAIARQAPAWQQRGEEIERTGQLPEDILTWIYDHKLFKLMVPIEFGGRPTPLPDLLRIFDELSAIDGSIGWLVHIGAAGGFFVPSFAKETARKLFAPREAVIAGSGFPAGRALASIRTPDHRPGDTPPRQRFGCGGAACLPVPWHARALGNRADQPGLPGPSGRKPAHVPAPAASSVGKQVQRLA